MVREGSLRRGRECRYLSCEKKRYLSCEKKPVMEEAGKSILSEGMAMPKDMKMIACS